MSQHLTQVVGRQVRRLRTEQRLSAQALAQNCATLGSPQVNRDVITNVENGRRQGITVEELAVLAFALNVSPSHLLVDYEDSSPVAVTGRVEASGLAMRAWLAGRAPLRGQDPRKFAGQAVPWMADLPAVDKKAIAAWRRLDELGKTLLPPVEDEAQLERIASDRAQLFAEAPREDVTKPKRTRTRKTPKTGD